MEWMHALEANLTAFVGVLKLILEAVSVLCVAAGLVVTAILVIVTLVRRGRLVSFAALRLRFGTWLALALEFQLASNILATTIAPSTQALLQLGAIAVIRTFLNYFLQKELEAEERKTRTPYQADAQRSRSGPRDDKP